MALTFIKSNKGANLLVIDSFSYRREKVIAGKEIWRCSAYTKWKCMSRCHTKDGIITKTPNDHNHVPDQCKIRGRKVITDFKKRPATMIESTYKMLPKYLKELNSAVQEYGANDLIIEGKTKAIYALPEYLDGQYVIMKSHDQITCGDGARKDILIGKGALSNATNAAIFEYLNNAGVRTHFHRSVSETECIVERCQMIPLEIVSRRLATGSYLKRNPGVNEGFRFSTPKMEYFFKDDANHDPQWSSDQILENKLMIGGLTIGQFELDEITLVAKTCFEILEKAWASRNCVLVDMKVEFGVTIKNKEIVLADVIDNDSWRIWPAGDKRLMKDKQVYRNLSVVTTEAMSEIRKNYTWVSNEVKLFTSKPFARVVIILGSSSDLPHAHKIEAKLKTLGVNCEIRISSAHKTTEKTIDVIRYYESDGVPTVFIAVAGRSNGLGPVLSGNTTYPVINCPPVDYKSWGPEDIWSSLRLPSGLGCTTTIDPEGAALNAAQILALTDHCIWSRIHACRLNTTLSLMRADKDLLKL
ncbi:multifunctional protein ADE2 isoform X2 [Hydra vulgaris]|uniref:multifunctional protein ADE2 isoform X2 n=1 Tax=Hydra vulgaris TaxID=6087 RepID=UPI001F5EF0C9|nr:multifunctional protein ADE2 isoform X1 [Hydra vulgaris]